MAKSSNRIGQQVGNDRLNRLLGHGGFADVHLDTHVIKEEEGVVYSVVESFSS